MVCNALYAGGATSNQAWLAGAGVSYHFSRSFALVLDEFTRTTNGVGVGALSSSRVNSQPYSDNLVTAGVTYHY